MLLVTSSTAESLVTAAVLAAVGVLFLLRIHVEFELLHAVASSETSSSQPSKTNCPSCGARTTVDGVCDYCEEPLADDSTATDRTDETGRF
ncbi:hypothetical protein SAMN04515672_2778 [Natronorubrum texcoconense]|uniref:Uncharacterized protein n=1 Tax=Natronorubrum texcoconense TaxID=1095776 RepID=A0A1G9AKB6_9EURY|nr:hypothetical protein SAMN04515672_2778 [Natronorubrum texcoconense]